MLKPNLILIHGALGSKDQLHDLTKLLEVEFETYTLNLSGHGGEELNYPFNIEGFSKQLIDFIEQNKLGTTNVFGYSMGGYTALSAAIKQPEMFQSISTLGTKFNWSPEIAEKEIKMLDPEKIEAKIPAFAKALKNRHHPISWKQVLNRTADLMIGLGHGKGLDKKDLIKLETVVHIGLGTEDNMVTKEESKEIAQLLPNGYFHSYPGFHHPIEKADLKVLSESLLEQFKNN